MSMAPNSSSNVQASHDGLLAAQKGLSRKISAYRKESAGEALCVEESNDLRRDLSDLVQEETRKTSAPQT